MSDEQTHVIYLAKAPIDSDFSRRKRVIYVQKFDDLKIIAQRFTKGIILFYSKSEGDNLYEIYEVETKYSIFRLKVLIANSQEEPIYEKVLTGGVIQCQR